MRPSVESVKIAIEFDPVENSAVGEAIAAHDGREIHTVANGFGCDLPVIGKFSNGVDDGIGDWIRGVHSNSPSMQRKAW